MLIRPISLLTETIVMSLGYDPDGDKAATCRKTLSVGDSRGGAVTRAAPPYVGAGRTGWSSCSEQWLRARAARREGRDIGTVVFPDAPVKSF